MYLKTFEDWLTKIFKSRNENKIIKRYQCHGQIITKNLMSFLLFRTNLLLKIFIA